jgi:hypothetical protein
MADMRKKFEDIMSAASSAKEGEGEAARQMRRGKEKALLVITGRESDRKAFQYALSICKRIGADLELLDVSASGGANPILEEFRKEAREQTVSLGVVKKEGCIREAVISHTNRRRDIQFVVAESMNVLDIDCAQEERKLRSVWKRLACPLVLVSEVEQT